MLWGVGLVPQRQDSIPATLWDNFPPRTTLLLSSCYVSIAVLPVEGMLEAKSSAACWRWLGKGRTGRQNYSHTVRNDPHLCLTPVCSSLRSSLCFWKQNSLRSVWSILHVLGKKGTGNPVRNDVITCFPFLSVSLYNLYYSVFLFYFLFPLSLP